MNIVHTLNRKEQLETANLYLLHILFFQGYEMIGHLTFRGMNTEQAVTVNIGKAVNLYLSIVRNMNSVNLTQTYK